MVRGGAARGGLGGLNGDEGRAGGGLPLGLLVGVVAAGGVEGRDADLGAGVALDGGGDGAVIGGGGGEVKVVVGIERRGGPPQAKLGPPENWKERK